jgi:hypothetical protein
MREPVTTNSPTAVVEAEADDVVFGWGGGVVVCAQTGLARLASKSPEHSDVVAKNALLAFMNFPQRERAAPIGRNDRVPKP